MENENSGASNAADFQPPTRNPQNPVSNLQSSGQGLQSGGGEVSQDDLNLPITEPLKVETAQSGTSGTTADAAREGNLSAWPGLAIFIVLIVVAALLYKRWNLFAGRTQVIAEAEPVPEVVSIKAKKKKAPKNRPKKKTRAKH